MSSSTPFGPLLHDRLWLGWRSPCKHPQLPLSASNREFHFPLPR